MINNNRSIIKSLSILCSDYDKTPDTIKRIVLNRFTDLGILSNLIVEAIYKENHSQTVNTAIDVADLIDAIMWAFAEFCDCGCMPEQIRKTVEKLRDVIIDEYAPIELENPTQKEK